jgi:RNA polymerase-binding transcription factor DksA
MISPTEMQTYKKKLQTLVKRFTGDVTQLQVETRQVGALEASAQSATIPLLSDDLDVLSAENTDYVLLENEQNLLSQCNAALRRIEEKTFGQCEDCRRPIPKRRLQAVPYTRYCLGCARLRERDLVR